MDCVHIECCWDVIATVAEIQAFYFSVFRPRVGISFTAMPMSTSTNISAAVSMVSDKRETIQLLVGVDDYYGGVIVDMSAHMDAKSFVSSLRASIAQWKQQGKRGVWIKLPIELVHLVQPAVQEGFWYHHAELNYLMLVYWIPDTPHTLPVNASHRVGVGAIVMNDKGEMLVVQEKTGRLKGTGIWKIPTGVVDEGENIFVGAIREVKEETGIDAEFLEVLAFRQSHKSFFGKSDLFFVCMLRPLSFDIQKQESEIEAAQWMPVNEYAAQPVVQKHELLRYIADIGLAKASEKGYAGFEPVVANSVFADQHQSYLMSPATYMFFAALVLSVSYSVSLEEGTSSEGTATPADCFNCTVCEDVCAPVAPPPPVYPCPPPPPVYPSEPPPTVYPSSPPPVSAQEKCQMSSCVRCCLYALHTPPRPNYYPYNRNSASPPFISSLLVTFLGAILWCFLLILDEWFIA
ncbi:hypothetical protein ACLOJK_035208 [Asimina triloba]